MSSNSAFFSLLRRVAGRLGAERWLQGTRSYAQCGEDLLVSYVFGLRGISTPSYLDIGAHHPYHLSNTALLYHRGSRGVNIEPNPVLFRLFERMRPDDINLNIGIGPESGEQMFYSMDDASLSTFSKTEYEEVSRHGATLHSTSLLRIKRLDEVITESCRGVFPDFLSIDVEGAELEILGAIDFQRHRPKVICLETAKYSPRGDGDKRTDLIDFVLGKGYKIYADSNLNTIFVESAFWAS